MSEILSCHCKEYIEKCCNEWGGNDIFFCFELPVSVWLCDNYEQKRKDYPGKKGADKYNLKILDVENRQLVVPLPTTDRTKIQEPFVREQQIDPKKYYPKGYHPDLLEEWPIESDLVVPIEALPAKLQESMGAHWRLKQKNQKILDEQKKK